MDFVDPTSLPFAEPRSRGELPHLQKDGCSYFVTFRLRDAVAVRPKAGANQRLRDSATVLAAATIAAASEPPLTLGSCALKRPELAAIVQDALLHFDGQRYVLSAWCVMPNHVHVVVTPRGERRLSAILHSWKSFTATRIDRILGVSGGLWERESFDHLIRSADHFEQFVWYTEENPVAAGLCDKASEWPYSSAHRRVTRGRSSEEMVSE
jgi:REP element-mobilizing transposase RayT